MTAISRCSTRRWRQPTVTGHISRSAADKVRCVLGTRAAMYAPVEGNALFLILDDVCYQDADGMMPYANARGASAPREIA